MAGRYPWGLVQRLSSRVEACRSVEAHADLDEVLGLIAAAPIGAAGLWLRKLRCAQVISFCLRGAHRAGAPSSDLLAEHLVVLDRLAGQRTWRAIVRSMHAYLDALLARLRPARPAHGIGPFLRRMDREMGADLESPRGLKHYAAAAGVTVAHLSRAYAAFRGLTFRDRLRQLRVDRARRLLIETRLKVSAVGRRVGWRDPSQFIGVFEQEVGYTPGAYRARHKLRKSFDRRSNE